MNIKTILENRKREISNAIAELKRELKDVDIAMKAISASHSNSDVQHHASYSSGMISRPTISMDAAVVEAVSNGQRKPMAVLEFMSKHMGIDTTINSVRTRLSRLNKAGKISKGLDGWVLPNEIEGNTQNENGPPKGGPDAEGATTPFFDDVMPKS